MPSNGPDRQATDVVGARIGAQLVDLILTFVQLLVVTVGLTLLIRPDSEAGIRGLVYLSCLTLPIYGGLLEGYWNGQTVGKWLLNVKVVDRRGNDPSVGQAFVRNLPAVVLFSWVTSAVALASMAMTDRRQRIFDTFADTYVVNARRTGRPRQRENDSRSHRTTGGR